MEHMSPVSPMLRALDTGKHYRGIFQPAFDAATPAQRCQMRFVYRIARKGEYSSPFSARSQVSTFVLMGEKR